MTPEGLVVVDKPSGMTSHDVVARARRALGTRKVGHAGTLDPMATGVLILGVGRATRMLGHIASHDKAYDATIVLGAETVTDDVEGEICVEHDASTVTDAEIAAAVAALTGTQSQVPSSVSAIKVDGRRAYARVRSGEEVALQARRVTVHAFDVCDVRRSGTRIELDVTVVCSTGTYVRALARDLGRALGCGGHLSRLRRTRVGGFGLDGAVPIDDVAPGHVMPMSVAARLAFPVVELSANEARDAVHGRPLPWHGPADDTVHALMAPDGSLVALAQRGAMGSHLLAVLGSVTS